MSVLVDIVIAVVIMVAAVSVRRRRRRGRWVSDQRRGGYIGGRR